MLRWFQENPVLLGWLGFASIVMVVGAIVFAPCVVGRLPADFFVREGPPPTSWRARHPVGRVGLRVLKNALGLVLVLAGIAMLVLPGQGILTILLGLGFVDLPGKRALERVLLARRPVRNTLQWLRRHRRQPPLELP